MRRWRLLGAVCVSVAAVAAVRVQVSSAKQAVAGSLAVPTPAPAPRLRVDTSAGAFTIETFPVDAPLTVQHIIELASDRFYDGQRVHRAIPGVLVQFGDPQTRDETKRLLWGRGAAASSGMPIGAAEITRTRRHKLGAVGVAHMGEPAKADSQIYIALGPQPQFDGRYAIFGQVVEGIDVPSQMRAGDNLFRVAVLP